MRAVVALGAVLLASISPAQAGLARKSGATVPQQKVVRYDTAPLDPSLENLKPNYLGHDCRGLAKKIVAINPQKGEFETTAAFKSRLDGLSSANVLGTVKLGDVVAFVSSSDMLSMLSEQYDADGQSLTLNDYIADGRSSVNGRLIASKKLESFPKHRRTYEASNAYGKKVSVESSLYETCALAFSNVDYMNSTSAYKRQKRRGRPKDTLVLYTLAILRALSASSTATTLNLRLIVPERQRGAATHW
jgi:hypothetical protein